MFRVTEMFACRISSCTTFTSSPFPLRSVAYVCRSVCQPKWPTIPISFAAGSKCALYSEPGQYGSLPPLCDQPGSHQTCSGCLRGQSLMVGLLLLPVVPILTKPLQI